MTDPTPLDRLWASFRALVRAELPSLTFLGIYEYRVTATDGTASTAAKSVDVTPTDASIALPSLVKVPITLPYGVTPPVGALATIQFMNGDPTRPTCTGFSDPSTLLVFAGGTLPNARQGDMTVVYLNTPTMVAIASGLVCAGPGLPPTINALVFPTPPAPVPVAAAAPMYGLVSSGNPQVKS